MNQNQAKEWLPLIQAAAEGKTLQLKVFEWVEGQLVVDWVETYGDVDFQTSPSRWRIKPDPKKQWYRMALIKDASGFRVSAINSDDGGKIAEKTNVFHSWLTDWIEYELPEGEA